MPKPINALFELLNKNQIPNVAFIFGEESFFKEQYIDELKNYVIRKTGISFNIYYPDDINILDLLTELYEVSMFTQDKVIVVKDFHLLKDKDRLISYIEKPNEQVFLFLIDENKYSYKSKKKKQSEKRTKKDTDFYEFIMDSDYCYESGRIYESQIKTWIKKQFEKNKVAIEREAVDFIFETTGDNLFELKVEIEKLITGLGDKKEISLTQLKNDLIISKKFTIFDYYNALHDKNFSLATEIGINLLTYDTKIVYIITMLTKYFSNILMYNQIVEKFKVPALIAKYIGTGEVFLKGYERAANNYKKDELRKIFELLLEKDNEIKQTNVEELTCFISLMARMKEICSR